MMNDVLEVSDWEKSMGWYGTLICQIIDGLLTDQIQPDEGARALVAIEWAQRRSGY
jgi:hypothetical protein